MSRWSGWVPGRAPGDRLRCLQYEVEAESFEEAHEALLRTALAAGNEPLRPPYNVRPGPAVPLGPPCSEEDLPPRPSPPSPLPTEESLESLLQLSLF